jgi:hypothetical protein
MSGELATEWVTILPETATLAKRLREFKPAPIKVPVEMDTDKMEREGREGGRRTGSKIDTEIQRETRGTGRAAARQVATGLNDHAITDAAQRVGKQIRQEVEKETRKISFRHIGVGILGIGRAVRETGQGVMTIIRNVGTMATIIRYAARAARGLSLSLLAGATAAKLITGAGIARLGAILGFTAKQADKLATQVARITSALLVAAAVGKFLSFMHKASKIMGIVTVGMGALTGLFLASVNVIQTWGIAAVGALTTVGAALGIAAGAAVGLLGPMALVAKIGFKGMSEGIKSVQKDWKDLDEAFYKTIGERMRPMLEAWHNLSNGITDAMSSALQPAFKNLGTFMDRIAPKANMLARTFGDLGNQVTDALLGPETQAAFDKMFDASNRFFRSFLDGGGLSSLSTGLVQFAATAADAFSGVGTDINDLMVRFGNFLKGVSADQMRDVFNTIRDALKNIWEVAGPVINVIRALGSQSANTLAPGFKAVGQALKDAAPLLIQMSQILMPALSKVMENLAPVLPELIKAFMPMSRILAVIAPPLATMVEKLAPLAPIILAVATAVKAATIALALYNTAMLLFTNITKIARTVQWLFNAALAANPIGLVVAAIAAVVAALTLFFTKTEYGRELWSKIWTGIKDTAEKVWNWLKVEGGKIWESLKPSLESLGRTAVDVFNQLKSAFQELWPKIQPVVEWLGKAWLAFQGFQWKIIIEAIKVVGKTIAWLVTNVAVPYFTLLINQAKNIWNVLKTVFDFIKGGWELLWAGVQIAWKVGEAVFRAVGDVISAVWNNVVKPIFDALGTAWDFIGGKLQWFGDLWSTVWNGLKAGVQAVWDFLKPVRDWLGDFFDNIGDLGEKAATAIKNAWNGLTNVLKAPLHMLGAFLQGLPTSILGVDIPFVKDLQGWGKSLAGLRTGGIIRGPGTGTSDSIVGLNEAGIPTVRVSNGEGVVPADVMSTPMGKLLFKQIMALRGGGMVPEGVIIWPPQPVGPTDKTQPGGVPNINPGRGPGIGLPDWGHPGTKFGAPPSDWWLKPVNPDDMLLPDWLPPGSPWKNKGDKRFRLLGSSLPGFKVGGQIGGLPGGNSGSGLNPGAQWLSDYIKRVFGVSDIGGRRSEDGFGEHSSGNALDIMVGSDKGLGDRIAGFLKTNKDTLGVDGMIWQQRSYGYGGGWDGKLMGDRGSPTQNHMDHVHVILGKGRGANAEAVGLPRGPIVDPTGRSTMAGSASLAYDSSGMTTNADGQTGSYVVDDKKVREANDRVTDLTNSLDIKQKKLDEYLRKQAAGEKVADTTIEAARDAVDKTTRDLDQAKGDLEEAKQGKFVPDKKSGSGSGSGSDDWSSVGGMIFGGFLEAMGLDGSVFKNLFETPNVKSAMAGLNWGLGLANSFLNPDQSSAGAPQDLGMGGGGGGGLMDAGMNVLAGIGEQAGVKFPPAAADQAAMGAGMGNGPVFDLRGSQLGVSPAAFEDKMGEMTAASKRHPTLAGGW